MLVKVGLCQLAIHSLVTLVLLMPLMQILAGNARKVSAVRFERLDNVDPGMDSKEVTRLVPKIMKKKWNSDEGSDGTEHDEDSFQKRPQNSLLDEHEDNYDSLGTH